MELPQNLDSKFRFVLVAARRARQLQSGAKPLIQTPTKRSIRSRTLSTFSLNAAPSSINGNSLSNPGPERATVCEAGNRMRVILLVMALSMIDGEGGANLVKAIAGKGKEYHLYFQDER